MDSGEVALRLLVQLAKHVMWIAFVVMHTAFGVILLGVAWATHTRSEAVWALLLDALNSHPFLLLSAFGASLLTIGRLYVWLWRRGYGKLMSNALFAPVLREARNQQDRAQTGL